MLLRSLPLNLLLCFFIQLTNAQIPVPFDTTHWQIMGEEFKLEKYKGKKALQLNNAAAYLENANFKEGIIEWDMAFPNQRGFTGLRFRVEDLKNFEEFYLRPHQSGQVDANQYCPVDNGLATWQLYHGEEYSAPYDYKLEEWFHVKMVISETRAEVYIDDMANPLLHIPFLKREPRSGGLMVYAGLVPTRFANFKYLPKKSQALMHDGVEVEKMDPMTIKQWSVSNSFAERTLSGVRDLNDIPTDNLKWTSLKSESSGTANLGRVAAFERDKQNTVFATVDINASREEIKAFHFGYSDRVKVYCNGQLIYSGDNGYRTRDFRYLGTIGYFDTVYLPLKKGKNEIWIAVSESFGGWGLRGKLEDMEGVKVIR